MTNIRIMDTSACARLFDEAINSSSFQALIGKVRTHRMLEQLVAFCISGLVALHAIVTSLNRLHGIKDRLIGNVNKYLVAASWPTIQDKRIQSEPALSVIE